MGVPVVPEIIRIPEKLTPMITEFNEYEYFLGEGGRGSGKSQSVGRFLLFLADRTKLRIVCGREIQANIEESVFTLLVDLIDKYDLSYEIYRTRGSERLVHRTTGTVIRFRGFREQGSVSIKGLEGIDILWIDEAQSITKHTLDVIIPTIRNPKRRIFFTMNRFLRDDPVFLFCTEKKNCLHIRCNYNDNEFCPNVLKAEALDCKARSERDYKHIWLGEPIQQADDYLFNFDKLHASLKQQPFGGLYKPQRVLGIDFAAQGNDSCVATTLDRLSVQHWGLRERLPWDYDDSMQSVGKIVGIIGEKKPDITIIDIGGMGKVVFDRLNEILSTMPNHKLLTFDGGSNSHADKKLYVNNRAAGYYRLVSWFDQNWLCIDDRDREVINELEKIKFKYQSNGRRVIQSKQDMKKEMRYSPDNADSLMMAVWATQFLGSESNAATGTMNMAGKVKRINKKSDRDPASGQKRKTRLRY